MSWRSERWGCLTCRLQILFTTLDFGMDLLRRRPTAIDLLGTFYSMDATNDDDAVVHDTVGG